LKKIIISRTDNIGDVVLTIPLAGIIKKFLPEVKVAFLGKSYTKSLIESCSFIDEFYNWDELKQNDPEAALSETEADAIIHVYPDRLIASTAKKAGIKVRVGTSHRFFHWWTCNKLINLGRKNSNLHEAQLNAVLLKGIGIDYIPSLKEIPDYYGFIVTHYKKEVPSFNNGNFNLILHTKSKGSGKEWPLKNYYDLAKGLIGKPYNVYITGTESEKESIVKEYPEIFQLPNVIDVTGRFSLSEFICFIKSSDGLIAASTGPLHISSALGNNTIGFYPAIRPLHATRWAAVGKKTIIKTLDKDCNDCRNTKDCACIKSITVIDVLQEVLNWKKN
jgi:heptosyltransferase III